MPTKLHVTSTYSLLKSTTTIDQLILKAKERGYTAIALTDHNVLYGAVEFYEKATKAGLKPILGLKLDIESVHSPENTYPILLLAKNEEGYKRLIQLSTKVMTEETSVALDDLAMSTDSLIAISPGITGEIEALLLQEDIHLAQKVLETYKKYFNRFFLGYSLHESLDPIRSGLEALSENYQVPLVAADEVNYIEKDDAFATDVLKTIGANETIDLDKELDNDQYLVSADELIERYQRVGLEHFLDKADEIANSTHLKLTLNQPVLPKFPIPENKETDPYLYELCEKALNQKVKTVTPVYTERLEKELGIISKMGFSDYFLIVWDLMKYAHSQNIVTGSGRGSAVGSLVSYVLNITDVDPIAYGLLFERFLNEERYSMPDIDLDFPDNKREQILLYVNQKYGNQHVAQIATFGTFAAKMALRDSGRVFGLSTQELKKWSDAIPGSLGMTLTKAMKESSKLKNLVNESEQNLLIYDTATKLEGLPRHVSTHAAGVVISDTPLTDSVPLQNGNSDLSLTQFAMADVEKVGLLKMDFLGLKNLTILSDCIQFARQQSKDISKLSDIPLNDPETLKLFEKGDTNGIFQFESPGIKRVLRKLGPTDIEDVVAVNALYRPGPMEQIDTFISRKKGLEPISYPHNDLESILDVTYGIMVYQEQVMKVASKLAGYSLAEADMLRRAISKKIKTQIDSGRRQFIQGALNKGYTEETAAQVYHYIEQFANYGFNRSHAVAYSMVAYQLAYFKTHYPAAFFAALMKASSNNKTKLQEYVLEARKRKVELNGPDINRSQYSFSLHENTIQFGLDIIKGLRRDLIYSIYKNRKDQGAYKDLTDFTSRLDQKWRKENYIKPLVYSGAFDGLSYNRGTMIRALEGVIESVRMSDGNLELFASLAPRIEVTEDIDSETKLEQEFEVTGFYFSEHPSEKYNKIRESQNIDYIADAKMNKNMKFIGTIKAVKTIQTKRGEPMSFVEIADQTASCSLTLFPEQHRKYIKSLKKDVAILVEGKVEGDSDRYKILVRRVELADTLTLEQPQKTLFLKIDSLEQNQSLFQQVQSILREYIGTTPVLVYDSNTGKKHLLKSSYSTNGSEELIKMLSEILGSENVILR
ncbi:DNA polymerase III subunit alpha [Marinilactibacillus sp. Marseille-P9653]|uniref:DNA polymerase III subunit alpha n=1 Tax=Marinilactibacillus sp. Marseille-P9653 TaxID=2866583 RepID=UPI001CE40D82|nr:DNA polymerase III subunit alpha [Marinilactibacillus sp. Marseille-P9653]